MIKIWFHKYELIPMAAIGAVADTRPRRGALLKCKWPNEVVGYADLFPWMELGDPLLEDHLIGLSQGKLSTLVEQSIWLAKKDADLRAQKKNAFVTYPKVKNHFLISDYQTFPDSVMKEMRAQGYTTFKVKCGRNFDEEARFVVRCLRQNPITVRLDFNSRASFSQIERFAAHFSPSEKARIEYVEDPMVWNPSAWSEASKVLPLALDLEYDRVNWELFSSRPPFSVIVIKPARQDVQKILQLVNRHGLKISVSNSLDHPVGMAHAALVAGELKKFYPNTVLDCSCITLRAYQTNDFVSRLQMNGPYIKQIPGTGIGFDTLLENTEWLSLQNLKK